MSDRAACRGSFRGTRRSQTFRCWLDWPDWDWKDGRYYHIELAGVPYDFEDGMRVPAYECSDLSAVTVFHDIEPPAHLEAPPSVMAWLENAGHKIEITL